MVKPNCTYCFFYKPATPKAKNGYCHYNPPVVARTKNQPPWPFVRDFDFCGKFKSGQAGIEIEFVSPEKPDEP